MKSFVLLFFLTISIPLPADDETIIENPARPGAANAGRVVTLSQTKKIDDSSGDFFFKYPVQLKVAPRGEIIIAEREALFLFDSAGKFRLNLYKKGQGPAEMNYVSNYCISGDKLIVYDSNPGKILKFELDGTYIDEFRVPQKRGFLNFVTQIDDILYFFKFGFPDIKSNSETLAVDQDLVSYREGMEDISTHTSFPIRSYVVAGKSGSRGMIPIDRLNYEPYGQLLIVSHSTEYLIKLYDLKEKRLLRSFRRTYKRVKSPPPKKTDRKAQMTIDNKPVTAPEKKYLDDIVAIKTFADRFWLFTSTVDRSKGVLVDVFSTEGVFTDNFYLQFPAEVKLSDNRLPQIWIHHSDIYIRGVDDDDNPVIYKYVLNNY